MVQNADGQILKGGTAFSKKRHKQLTQVWYEIPPLTTTVKCPNNFTVSFNLLHWSCSQTPGLWKMTWKFLFHSCKWAALVAMPNTISKEMEIHQRQGSEWRYHNIRRRLDHLCVIWLRDSYVACIEPSGCMWFYDFIFLSLPLSLTPAASEGRVNGGEDFFQKVSVKNLDNVCFVSGLCSSPLSQHFSLGKAADVRCSSSHSQLQIQANKNKGTTLTLSHSRGSDLITQLTQHCGPFSLT